MDISFFIASRLRFRGRTASICIAVSFTVMIIAVAVSSGFRLEIRKGLSDVTGDVQLVSSESDIMDSTHPISSEPSYLSRLLSIEQVDTVLPAIYRAGIIKHGENIHGVLFKGEETADSTGLGVSIPSTLSDMLGLHAGDSFTAYFISDKVKVRKFRIDTVYESVFSGKDNIIVHAGIEDLRRINGWESAQVSALEIMLKDRFKDEKHIREVEQEAGFIAGTYSSDDEPSVIASSSVSRYPQMFDWLNLIDFNVLFILILMTVVAGFNMISGLLILMFENISTIGLLKSLGMSNGRVARIFIAASSSLLLKGMLAGNLVAFAFCLIQSETRLLKLDPANYFLSHVPVNISYAQVLLADFAAYAVIMLLLIIPCRFISKVDPADTVRVR